MTLVRAEMCYFVEITMEKVRIELPNTSSNKKETQEMVISLLAVKDDLKLYSR